MRDRQFCVEIDRMLAASDQCGEPDLGALERHVEQCARCQTKLDQTPLDAEFEKWRLLFASSPLPRTALGIGAALAPEPETWPKPNAFQFPPSETPGDLGRLGEYRILSKLGEGNMGAVFLAEDTRMGRQVALKILRPELGAAPRFRERFEREARSAAAVRHEQVITIYHVANTPDFSLPYLVMEYIAGETLAARLHSGPLPARTAAAIACQVARGLGAAHAKGVVHRDVKPSNIMLEKDSGRALVTDFGLARAVNETDRLSLPEAVVGTPSYMSPEQILPPHTADPRSDVFGLGILLYQMLTGERPFRGTSPSIVMQQIVHVDPLPPRRLNADISRDLETITLKCLAKEASARYASATAVADDLQRLLNGQPIWARPISPVGRLRRWCRRNPALASAAAMVLVTVASAFGLITRFAAEKTRAFQTAALNLGHAVEAVDVTLRGVSDPASSSPELLTEEKKKILDDLLNICRALLNEHDPDPAVRRITGQAYRQIADVQRLLGRYDEASAAYEKADSLLRALHGGKPSGAATRHQLATCCNGAGILALLRARPDQARQSLDEARTLREQLVEEDPANWEYKHGLAKVYMNLSLIDRSPNPTAAASNVKKSLELLRGLVQDRPDTPDVSFDLARALSNASILSLLRKDPAAAARDCQGAVRILDELKGRHPVAPKHRQARISALTHWALAAQQMGQIDQAQKALADAAAQGRLLVSQFPDEPSFKGDLGLVYCNQGKLLKDPAQGRQRIEVYTQGIKLLRSVLEEQKMEKVRRPLLHAYLARGEAYSQPAEARHLEALQDWDHGLALTREIAWVHSLRARRARTLAHLPDRHGEAVLEAEALAAENNLIGDDLFHLACALAVASRQARQTGQPADKATAWATRAIELLKRAGADKDFHLATHAGDEPDLEALHALGEFQGFVKKPSSPPLPPGARGAQDQRD